MARVIREDGPPRRVVPADALRSRDEAARVLREAHAEAERLRAQAQAQADHMRRAAEAEGRRAAEADAVALLTRAVQARDRILGDAHVPVVEVAMAVARRVIGDHLTADPARMRDLAHRALEHARRARKLTLRVHPEDVKAVHPLAQASAAPLTVTPDPGLARGDCVLHTDVGDVDARLDVQLASLERALRDVAGS